LLDKIHSKRMAIALGVMVIAAGALIISLRPAFPLTLAADVQSFDRATGRKNGVIQYQASAGLSKHNHGHGGSRRRSDVSGF
jgi:hypothetical protein